MARLTNQEIKFVMLLLGVMILISSILTFYSNKSFKINGEYANAVIYRFSESGKYGRNKSIHYNYIVNDAKYSGGGRWYPKSDTLSVGDTITIIYNKKNPAKSIVRRDYRVSTWWFGQSPDLDSQSAPPSVVESSFTDPRNGQKYYTVKIGEQVWMAENLNFVTDSSWCYDNDDANCEKYGRLYSWDAAMGACPAGWRLPDTADWNALAQVAGGGGQRMEDEDGDYYWDVAGKTLKSTTGWRDTDGKAANNGTDMFGFSAMPGGGRSAADGFFNIGVVGFWWSATENGSSSAYSRFIFFKVVSVYESHSNKGVGLSVRCAQN